MTVVHEFQTLALAPLVARHDGRDAWLPGVGLVPRPIPGAPAPDQAGSTTRNDS